MKTCPHCGKENLDRAKFCGYCGRSLAAESEVTRRVVSTEKPGVSRSEKTASIRYHIEAGTNRTSLLPYIIILIGLLFVGSIIVLGLTRVNQPQGDAGNDITALLMPFVRHTPTPTAIPSPSALPPPSATAAPSATPLPANTPTPVHLGARRSEIQTMFADLGFAFHQTSPLGEQARIIGRSIDKSVSIELVGGGDRLIKATLIAGESNIGDQDLVIMVYMTRLLQRLLPEWRDAKNWLEIGLKQIANSEEIEPVVATASGNTRISLKRVKEMRLTFLTIEGEPAADAPVTMATPQAP
jgi:hypothetical protein